MQTVLKFRFSKWLNKKLAYEGKQSFVLVYVNNGPDRFSSINQNTTLCRRTSEREGVKKNHFTGKILRHVILRQLPRLGFRLLEKAKVKIQFGHVTRTASDSLTNPPLRHNSFSNNGILNCFMKTTVYFVFNFPLYSFLTIDVSCPRSILLFHL